jgi:hypothetical protein
MPIKPDLKPVGATGITAELKLTGLRVDQIVHN